MSVRPAVVDVIRRAIAALPTGDPTPVVRAVRNNLDGLPRRDRIRFTATLAWAAAHLASELPADRRERLLAALEASDEALAVGLLANLLRSTAGGARND